MVLTIITFGILNTVFLTITPHNTFFQTIKIFLYFIYFLYFKSCQFAASCSYELQKLQEISFNGLPRSSRHTEQVVLHFSVTENERIWFLYWYEDTSLSLVMFLNWKLRQGLHNHIFVSAALSCIFVYSASLTLIPILRIHLSHLSQPILSTLPHIFFIGF